MKNKPSNTVYLSNLSYERDRNGLKSLISKYGVIKYIKIIVEPTTLQSRGMAFIEMGSVAEATKAIENLNGKIVDGRTLKANFAIPQREETKRAEAPRKKEKDLDYKATQLAKKARNDAKRKAKENPFAFKKVAKKVAKKVSKKVTQKS